MATLQLMMWLMVSLFCKANCGDSCSVPSSKYWMNLSCEREEQMLIQSPLGLVVFSLSLSLRRVKTHPAVVCRLPFLRLHAQQLFVCFLFQGKKDVNSEMTMRWQ